MGGRDDDGGGLFSILLLYTKFSFFFFFLNKNTLPLLRWCKVKIILISRLVELFDWSRFLFFCYFIFLCIFDGRFLIVRPSVSIYHWPFRNAPSFPFFFFFYYFAYLKRWRSIWTLHGPLQIASSQITTTKSTLSKTLFFFSFSSSIKHFSSSSSSFSFSLSLTKK